MTVSVIVDANLPPALAAAIAALGHPSVHVADIVAVDVDDADIWTLAKVRNAIVVTKDSDFAKLAAIRPNGPPIVWLRMGNTRKRALLARIAVVWPDVLAALAAGEAVVEVR